ncbi:hypothetical protein IGK74_002440 [Enterococcus sp. AZ150]|uniref:hypothetical protein n=1 Tax=Enterococcus sp. AZ150 TaxID=2774866 RepID=UPI003F22D64F
MENNNILNIDVKINGIEEAIEKAEHYHEILQEAKKIAEELSNVEFKIKTI